jgi:hypothetical protein
VDLAIALQIDKKMDSIIVDVGWEFVELPMTECCLNRS